jgi:hypothetical protein
MEYLCKDPKATVRAANVLATIEAFQLLPHLVEQLLPRHGLERKKLLTTLRVPVQSWLNLLRDISERVGDAKVRQGGTNIVEIALFPATLTSVEDVLLALNDIYALNHTGTVGRYVCSRGADGSVRVACSTPYPRAFERGLVEGITRNRTLAKDVRYAVTFEEGVVGADLSCVMTVRRM